MCAPDAPGSRRGPGNAAVKFRPKAKNVLFIWATLFYHGHRSVEIEGSPDLCLCTAPALTLRFAYATVIFSLFMNADKHLHLGGLFLTFK